MTKQLSLQLSMWIAMTLLGAATPAQGATILERLGDPSFQCCSFEATAFTWTQTGTWTNVQIDIPAYNNESDGTLRSAVVYLTNSLGPGTTEPANEIDEAILSSTIQGSQTLTAFTGLTLGPGTYHLTHHTVASVYGNGLLVTFNSLSPLVTAPGVAEVGYAFEDVEAPYHPASTFNFNNVGMHVSITGTPDSAEVPEPATGFLALGALIWILRRRR
jgi:hypothetical protein